MLFLVMHHYVVCASCFTPWMIMNIRSGITFTSPPVSVSLYLPCTYNFRFLSSASWVCTCGHVWLFCSCTCSSGILHLRCHPSSSSGERKDGTSSITTSLSSIKVCQHGYPTLPPLLPHDPFPYFYILNDVHGI